MHTVQHCTEEIIKKADAFYSIYVTVHLLSFTSWTFLPEVPLRDHANSVKKV